MGIFGNTANFFEDAADDLLDDITGGLDLGGGEEEELDQGGEPDIGEQKLFAPRTISGEIDVL